MSILRLMLLLMASFALTACFSSTGEGSGSSSVATGSGSGSGSGSGTGGTTGGGGPTTPPTTGGAGLPAKYFLAGAAVGEISPTDGDIACDELDGNGDPQCFNLGGYGTRELGACTPDNPFFVQCGTALPHPGPANGRAQPAHVRVLALKTNQADEAVIFMTLDAIGAGNIILRAIRQAVNAQTGVPESNIIIGETHSHSAADLQGLWGGVPQRWRNALYDQAASIAKAAFDALEPVELKIAEREVDFNRYRREAGDDPSDPNAKYLTDKIITAMQASALDDGATIATLTQYTAHTTVLGSSNRLVHTDYVLGLHETVQNASGGVSVFYNGPIADAAPKAPSNDDPYARADGMGMALGIEVIGMLSTGTVLPAEPLLVRHQNVILPVTNPLFLGAGGLGWFEGYYDFTDASGNAGRVETLVSRVRIGEADGVKLEIATIPGEATGPFGAMLRGLAGGDYQMLMGLTQNSLGYILPADEFGREGNNYEETVSLGPTTAPTLENAGYRVIFDALAP